MEEFDKLLNGDQNTLLMTIDEYQSEIIREFLKSTSNDYLQSADKWLNAGSLNIRKFGGESNNVKIFRDKLFDEVEKFLCGDITYEDDRNKIATSTDKSNTYIVGVMSAAIGNELGASGVFIAPVIVLVILSIKKMAINAWCAMRIDAKISTGNSSANQSLPN